LEPPAEAMAPATLADVFGVGVMAARAQQDYAARIEHALREHHDGHTTADYLRTIEHQRNALIEQSNRGGAAERDASLLRVAVTQVAEIVGIPAPATLIELAPLDRAPVTAKLSEWVQSVRAEVMRLRRPPHLGFAPTTPPHVVAPDQEGSRSFPAREENHP